jgi:geranylgeranyl diphosphate synthase type II
MMELDWIRGETWTIRDQDYVRMVYKKTTWYTFIAPVTIGAMAARAPSERVRTLVRFATLLGIAFQIQDDVLNLVADETHYGKEINGDLWEGKHTLILIHAMRSARESERAEALRILRKMRPNILDALPPDDGDARVIVERLREDGLLSESDYVKLRTAFSKRLPESEFKTQADVEFLRELVERYDGLGYAARVAENHIQVASRCFRKITSQLPPSTHLDFLRDLVDFVIRRTH